MLGDRDGSIASFSSEYIVQKFGKPIQIQMVRALTTTKKGQFKEFKLKKPKPAMEVAAFKAKGGEKRKKEAPGLFIPKFETPYQTNRNASILPSILSLGIEAFRYLDFAILKSII